MIRYFTSSDEARAALRAAGPGGTNPFPPDYEVATPDRRKRTAQERRMARNTAARIAEWRRVQEVMARLKCGIPMAAKQLGISPARAYRGRAQAGDVQADKIKPCDCGRRRSDPLKPCAVCVALAPKPGRRKTRV